MVTRALWAAKTNPAFFLWVYEGKDIGSLLVALRYFRSGKSSIQRVVFHKMSPHETLFLEGTNSLDIKYIANNSFVQFQIWDFPGDFDFKGSILLLKWEAEDQIIQ